VALHVRSGDLLGRTSRDQFGRTSLVDAARRAISLGEPAAITLAEPTAISLAEPRAISYAGPSHASGGTSAMENEIGPAPAPRASVTVRLVAREPMAALVRDRWTYSWFPAAGGRRAMSRHWFKIDCDWVKRREALLVAHEDEVLRAARDEVATDAERAFVDGLIEARARKAGRHVELWEFPREYDLASITEVAQDRLTPSDAEGYVLSTHGRHPDRPGAPRRHHRARRHARIRERTPRI
jgi:hypothetical protein